MRVYDKLENYLHTFPDISLVLNSNFFMFSLRLSSTEILSVVLALITD